MGKEIKYNREYAIKEFSRCYRQSFEKIAEPKKWLTSEEIKLVSKFDQCVRAQIDLMKSSELNLFSIHCEIKIADEAELRGVRGAIYWIIETALSQSPKCRMWHLDENIAQLYGEKMKEYARKLVIDWNVNLKEYYSEEVWK